MIKARQVFSWTFHLKGHGFHGDKATILFFLLQNIIHCLCCLKNFIFLKPIRYIKRYGHLNVWC